MKYTILVREMLKMDSIIRQKQLSISEVVTARAADEAVKIGSAASYDYWEAVYVISGLINVIAGGRVLKCKTGTLTLHKPGELHFIKPVNGSDAKYCIIGFCAEGGCIPKLQNAAVELSAFERLVMDGLLADIGDEPESGLPERLLDNPYLSERFIVGLELLLLYCAEKPSVYDEAQSADARLFSSAVKIMEENLLFGLSVENLADKLNISLSYLKRIFANFTSAGVHEYFTALKINRAKEMLKEGVSVTKTAELTGFNNQNYFSAAFKRITGILPKDYAGVKRVFDRNATSKSSQTKANDMPSYLL